MKVYMWHIHTCMHLIHIYACMCAYMGTILLHQGKSIIYIQIYTYIYRDILLYTDTYIHVCA